MYLDELNEQQLEAVKATEGYVRVIAGAGSGKTRVLTARYIYLVREMFVDPTRILCVTFTRKAAAEMKDRIVKDIGDFKDKCHISTFHSFALSFLKEEISVLGFSHGFKVADEDMQKGILRKILSEKEKTLDSALFYDLVDMIRQYKLKDLDYVFRIMNHNYPDHVLKKIENENDDIVDKYFLTLRKNKLLDFDDLIIYTYVILTKLPEARKSWQNKFDYVEIDEGQDTSLMEMEIMEIVSGKCKNLFLVGDPDQNIYEWRQSDNSILMNFDKRHPSAKTFLLTINYRSCKKILEASNSLISHNKNRYPKALIPIKEDGEKVRIYSLYDSEDVASTIVKLIEESRLRGDKYQDNAVLYRCNFNSEFIEQALKEHSLPYEIIGGVSFYELMEIKDAIAFIKFLAFDDDGSFERIANRPARKFGPAKIHYLKSMQGDKSLYETLKAHIMDEKLKGTTIEDFITAIEKVKKNMDSATVYDTLKDALVSTGYLKYLDSLKDKSHLENIQSFLDNIKAYSISNPNENDLGKYYSDYLFMEDEEQENKDRLQLMTIHASKGLEFKNVYVIGFDKGIFPHAKSLKERKDKGLEEERRLCYVSMTRAKNLLCLFHAESNSFHGNTKESIFLKEISASTCVRYDSEGPSSSLEEHTKRSNRRKKQKKDVSDIFASIVFGKK